MFHKFGGRPAAANLAERHSLGAKKSPIGH